MDSCIAWNVAKVVIAILAAPILSAPAAAQLDPHERITYRVRDYTLQAPWRSYPEGEERAEWECLDETAGTTVNCSAAGGPIERFRFIFQREVRRPPVPRSPGGGVY